MSTSVLQICLVGAETTVRKLIPERPSNLQAKACSVVNQIRDEVHNRFGKCHAVDPGGARSRSEVPVEIFRKLPFQKNNKTLVSSKDAGRP